MSMDMAAKSRIMSFRNRLWRLSRDAQELYEMLYPCEYQYAELLREISDFALEEYYRCVDAVGSYGKR